MEEDKYGKKSGWVLDMLHLGDVGKNHAFHGTV